MGRKSKDTSIEVRKIIFNMREQGKTLKEISSNVKKPISTIHSILKRNTVYSKQRCGRPVKLTLRTKSIIVRKIKEQPKMSAPQINKEVAEYSGIKVSDETVRRVLRSAGYNGRTARRKPYVSEINRKKRLQFAKEHIHCSEEFWNSVIFSDETKYNIFGPDGNHKVWRKRGEEMHHRNTIPTVKHGGGSVMLWGCMSANGVGNIQFIENTMNQFQYIDILKNNLSASAEKMMLSGRYIFQHDNDPKHTALNTKTWVLYNTPKTLKTPPQSPDLNPIEHLWAHLEKKIRKHPITSKSSLKDVISEEWSKITPNVTKNLVLSMPRRLREVIKLKGYLTKY